MGMNFDIRPPSPETRLRIELQGRLTRRHLLSEPWQRDCIREVIKRIRLLKVRND